MKSKKVLWLLPLLAAPWFFSPAAHTEPRAPFARRQVPIPTVEFTVKITGARQGVFQGDTSGAGNQGMISGLRFTYEVLIPRDPVSGQFSGKRQHRPLTFTKSWGAATPQILQAFATNENLTTVVFEFHVRSPEGEDEIDHTITLKNASLVDFKQYATTALLDGSTGKLQVEDVAFAFQKIQFQDNRSGITTEDSWND